MRIEICGGIGAGKTSLVNANLFSSFVHVKESFKQNPFWEAFYKSPGDHAFETEITFLLQHYHDVKRHSGSELICDFSFAQDLAFAEMGLTGNRLKLFREVAKECLSEIGFPTATIYLNCSPSILLQRITERGRPEEMNIGEEFLKKLSENIEKELSHEDWKNRLTLDSEKIDFRKTGPELERVIRDIKNFCTIPN